MAPSWHWIWVGSAPGPHAMAALHQWQASLHSNLINPNYQLFSQHSGGIFKIPSPLSAGKFCYPGFEPRLPDRDGPLGRARPRMTPGLHPAIRESPVSGRLASWQHTSPQHLGSCQHPLHRLYKVGDEQEYKGMLLSYLIISSNKQRETWKFGNHNMKMGSIFISSAGNNKSEMDCWVVTAQCALCSDSHAHICDWKMRRERFILDDDTMW